MAYADPTNPDALAAAFSAADSLGFKIFFSFDYAGNGAWPKADMLALIQQYSAHVSYDFYKGQAFVSTFEGPARADDCPEIKAATDCFFIPVGPRREPSRPWRRGSWMGYSAGRAGPGAPRTWTPTWTPRISSIWSRGRA